MSGALGKGTFWREVKYAEQWWAIHGYMKPGWAPAPRPLTSAQSRRIRKKWFRQERLRKLTSAEANRRLLEHIMGRE